MVDITEHAHKRGGDGQLLPVTKQIDVRGVEEPVDVDILPATTGQRREYLQKLDRDDGKDGDDSEVSAELETELFETFTDYEPADFGGARSWDDVRPAITDALANAILAEIFDTEEDDFSEALRSTMDEVTAEAGNLDLEG